MKDLPYHCSSFLCFLFSNAESSDIFMYASHIKNAIGYFDPSDLENSYYLLIASTSNVDKILWVSAFLHFFANRAWLVFSVTGIQGLNWFKSPNCGLCKKAWRKEERISQGNFSSHWFRSKRRRKRSTNPKCFIWTQPDVHNTQLDNESWMSPPKS